MSDNSEFSARFERSAMLLGEFGMEKLKKSKVLVCGVGGVGSYVCEGLVRCGVGHLTLVDFDVVSPSNINRQIHAHSGTIGQEKTIVMKERALSINPRCDISTSNLRLDEDNIDQLGLFRFDAVVDAIDSMEAKTELVCEAAKHGVPIISSMGMANKLLPQMIELADIYQTSVCPVARIMRKKLKDRGIKSLQVCYTKEAPRAPYFSGEGSRGLGSVSFVPSVAGLIIAGWVVNLLSDNGQEGIIADRTYT